MPKQPDYDNEVPLSRIKHALQEPLKVERIVKDAIAALPEDERDAAGGLRTIKMLERSIGNGNSTEFYVNKDFLAQLVLDGVVKTNGENAGKRVGDLIAEAGLASKWPQGRQ